MAYIKYEIGNVFMEGAEEPPNSYEVTVSRGETYTINAESEEEAENIAIKLFLSEKEPEINCEVFPIYDC